MSGPAFRSPASRQRRVRAALPSTILAMMVVILIGLPLWSGTSMSTFAVFNTFQNAATLGLLALAVGLFDIANGMAVRESPAEVEYPNIDLTAHLVREPRGEWVGFDTRVTFGAGGLGLTHSILHDEDGPLGSLAQTLTVRT